MGDREAVLGIDVGTSSLKAGLFGLDGALFGLTSAAYPLSVPEEGANEQDPRDWWAALVRTTRELLQGAGRAARVVAVGIGGQAPTLAPADTELRPTHPAITWLDARTSLEADRLYARLGEPVPVWGSWPSQAAWFVRNRPDELSRTRWLFGCPDYLASRLTRKPVALLSITDAELEAGRLQRCLFPPAWTPGGIIAGVDAAAALETGLPAGTPVVGGHVDGLLGVLGSGVHDVGEASLNGGTSGTLSVVSPAGLGFPMFGLDVLGTATNTSGKALDWFLEAITGTGADGRDVEAWSVAQRGAGDARARRGYAWALALAGEVPPGADGLLFLPHLAGERGSERDPYSRGAWVGLTLGHDRRHLARSVLEGVAFSFRGMREWLASSGAPVVQVRSVGGQARSDLWNQIKADVLGQTVLVPHVVEAAVLGAAILAAQAIGAYASVGEASHAMVRVTRRFEPEPSRVALYGRLYEAYRAVYPALRETSWRLHDVAHGASSPTRGSRSLAPPGSPNTPGAASDLDSAN